MGSCLSKKSTSSTILKPQQQIEPRTQGEKKIAEGENGKKEILVTKQRRSHEVERRTEEDKNEAQKMAAEVVAEKGKDLSPDNAVNDRGVTITTPLRTSSCTKEEVDAILIQCGRLSRSSSTGKDRITGSENGGNPPRGRKFSGSKRSFDFDNEHGNSEGQSADGNNDAEKEESRHRQSHRQSRADGSPSSGRRRRTPSRERDQMQQNQRSGSRERNGSGGGRRVSRSPGRRSESPITTSTGANSNNAVSRPGKMVSVPATVTSLTMDKSNNAGPGGGLEPNSTNAIKRVQVKRTAGGDSTVGSRTNASPRARSPARANAKGSNENQNVNLQQPVSLSRSNSRKAEHSPYKRNPLSEIDTNIVMDQMPLSAGIKSVNNIISQTAMEKGNADNTGVEQSVELNNKVDHNSANCKSKEHQQLMARERKGLQGVTSNSSKAPLGLENLKSQTVTRSRSFRASHDLDSKSETQLNLTPSYTTLLLEDIQNFQQKSTTCPAFNLPPSVTKACSILEAVADLNSSTGLNMFATSAEDRTRNPTSEKLSKSDEKTTGEPFMETEVVDSDDLMQPSFHKYVTVRRGMVPGDDDLEEKESSGSNSFVGSQEHWLSPSWEPNSVDSTDSSIPSMSRSRKNNRGPFANQRHAISELGQQHTGSRRGRVGS